MTFLKPELVLFQASFKMELKFLDLLPPHPPLKSCPVRFVFEQDASIFPPQTVFMHVPPIFHVSAEMIFNNSSRQQINSLIFERGRDECCRWRSQNDQNLNQTKRQLFAHSMLNLNQPKILNVLPNETNCNFRMGLSDVFNFWRRKTSGSIVQKHTKE